MTDWQRVILIVGVLAALSGAAISAWTLYRAFNAYNQGSFARLIAAAFTGALGVPEATEPVL
jgi:hypothetical protein